MKVVVTGANGYIGRNVVRVLAEQGHEVLGIDDLSNSEYWKKGTVMNQMMRDFEGRIQMVVLDCSQCAEIMAQFGAQAAIHLAADKSVIASKTNFDPYWRNNVDKTVRFARAAWLANVKTLVYSSSAAVYGAGRGKPLKEIDPLLPTSNYGRTKLASELFLQGFAQESGMKIAGLRYFNVCGAGMYGVLGDSGRDRGSTLFGACISAHMNPEKPLKIRGKNHRTPDGYAIRDLIHVEDLARAHHEVLEFLSNESSAPDVYVPLNVGVGVPYSVLQVVDEFAALGYEVPYEVVEPDSTEVAISCSDPRWIKTLTQWRPQHGLQSMIKTAIAYEKSLQKG